VDSIPCEFGNSSFVVILNVLKCTACKQVREYIILSLDSSIPTNECTKNIPSSSFDQEAIKSSITSYIEKTFEDEDDPEINNPYLQNNTINESVLPSIFELEVNAKNRIVEGIINFFQYYLQQMRYTMATSRNVSEPECKRNLRAAPTTTSFPIIEGQLFESDDYDIFLEFEQEVFMFKVILFSAACSFLVHTDNGWKNNQYLLAHLYNDSAQLFTFIVLSHRNLHELPRSLTNVLRTFHETFVIPKCSMHVSSGFMSMSLDS